MHTGCLSKTFSSWQNQKKTPDRNSTASSDGDSSDTDGDKRLSGPPLTPKALALGRISETTEEEAMVEEEIVDDSLPQVPIVSPSQAWHFFNFTRLTIYLFCNLCVTYFKYF